MDKLKKAIEGVKVNEAFNRIKAYDAIKGMERPQDIKAFAMALRDELLDVAGEEEIEYKKLSKIVIDILKKA